MTVAEDKAPHTILVVDDDVLIRLSIAEYLRDCGYRVLEAAHAGEAIHVLASSEVVDLVFSDVQMPGSIDGFGLARWVRENRPGVKVILTSGYAKAAAEAHELCDEGPISKPYDHRLLVEKIRRHLGGRANGNRAAC